jgi:hypothetical protein
MVRHREMQELMNDDVVANIAIEIEELMIKAQIAGGRT